MSFPRLAFLVLGLPLLTGGCAISAVTAASYGADGASYAESGKSTTDHFASMVSKKDCALWRVFRNENVCHEREPGAKDPYQVNYDAAERMPSEDGMAYAPPLHQTAAEPNSSWTAEAYAKRPEAAPAAPAEPVVAAAEPAPPPPVEAKPAPVHQPVKKKAKATTHRAVAYAKPVKKASPGQVAFVP